MMGPRGEKVVRSRWCGQVYLELDPWGLSKPLISLGSFPLRRDGMWMVHSTLNQATLIA